MHWRTVAAIKRFQKNVGQPDENGCMPWLGGSKENGYGYGQLTVDGIKYIGAHRISYFIHNGKFDQSKEVCHSCDNKTCVNPEHLWLGTHSENMIDMSNKGGGSKFWKGKTFSAEHRQKLSKSGEGRKLSEIHKQRIGTANRKNKEDK